MPTKEEDFKQRFAVIVADMQGSGHEDLLMVGSLAAQLADHAGNRTWTRFKAKLSKADYGALLTTFQTQGNALARQGALRQMHAVEVLACSLIARTQLNDPQVLLEDKRLDGMIDRSIRLYRDSQAADPILS